MKNKLDIGRLILGNLKLAGIMKNAHKHYAKIESAAELRLKQLDYSSDLVFTNKNLSFIESYKKNFFTFLMISILDNMKIPKERVILYGEITFCLRGIVTATDNIIDNEKKGVIFLNDVENSVVNNTLLLMTLQNVLLHVLNELGCSEKGMTLILNKIHSIAKSESLRNSALYDKYPAPQYIIDNIHTGIGGELLQLALWIPEIMEGLSSPVSEYNKALFDIGMALQALDDLCDMSEDFSASQVNLGISVLKYQYDTQYNPSVNPVAAAYPEMCKNYSYNCINTALTGFNKLSELGYPLSRNDSLVLLQYLFELRGIKDLWEISEFHKKKSK